ncbi:MAG: glycosyltransferase family 9 protein, partial [Agromyces sp.]|nr:glycosyltransferase family 9 protein [Agromyces sp.]
AAPDEVIILTSFHQSPLPLAMLLRLIGVPRIIGASVDYAGSLLDVRLRPGEDFPESQSEVARNLAVAEAAGFELPHGDDGRLAITTGPMDGPFPSSGGYVVVHPGAAVSARRWPAWRHSQAVRMLTEAGVAVVVTGDAGERSLTRFVADGFAVDLGGRTDLPRLAAVLAGADAVVVGNTGAAHLAAAVGTPVVSLFAPVVDERCWRPFGVPTVVLGRVDAPCAGSRARTCPVPGHPCLADVGPEQVVDAVLAIRRNTARSAITPGAEAIPA